MTAAAARDHDNDLAIVSTARSLHVIWPQLLGIAGLLLISAVSIWLMNASRAYVNGEALWSRSQKNAVVHLLRYIDTQHGVDRQRYLDAIAVPLGDARARVELEKNNPDFSVVRDGFIQGRNHPDDIDGMIGLYRWFRHYPKLDEAIAVWAVGDSHIAQLQEAAAEVNRLAGSPMSPPHASALRAQVLDINQKLEPLEEQFSRSIAEAARELSAILFLVQLLCVGLLIFFAIKINRRILLKTRSAESNLRLISEKLEFALRGSVDGLWDWDLATDVFFYSDQFRHQLGYAEHASFEHFRLWKEFHPDDAERVNQAVDNHLWNSGKPLDEECRVATQSGKYIWVHLRGQASRDAGGKAVRFSGAITDITHRVEIQQALSASKELQKALFDAANDVILVVDEAGLIRFANPAVERLFSWSPIEVIGQPIAIFQPERLRAAHDAGFHRYMQTSVRKLDWRQTEAIGLRKNGEEFPIELSFSEVFVNGERLFATFMRDTSQLKVAQSEMERAKLLLDATQAISRVGGWELHVAAGNQVYWTAQMHRMLGVTVSQRAYSLDFALGFFAPESREMVRTAIHEAIENGIAFDHEVEMISATGKRMWMHSKCGLEIENGKTVKMRATLRDITAQKTALEGQRLAWDVQKGITQQLDTALNGAEVALWGFVPSSGVVTHAQRWNVLLGYAQMPVRLKDWDALVHPDDAAQRKGLLDQHLRGETTDYEAEYRMRHADGHWVTLRCRGRVTSRSDDGKPLHYGGAVVDISAQMAARQVVSDQHQFLQAMIEGVDTGVVVLTESTVIYANASFLRMLGYQPNEHIEGSEFGDLLAEEGLAIVAQMQSTLEAGLPVPVGLFRVKMKSGQLLKVALNLSRVMWNGKPHFIGTATPLSEQDMLEVLVRSTQSRFDRVLVSELEKQQAHIARELHDSLGSELAGLSLVLGGTRSLAAQDTQITRHLDMALQLVTSAAEVTRAMARGLLPVGDNPGAFWRALEQLTADLVLVKGIACDFEPEGELDQISAEVGNHLYRVAQEAAANAIRHGKSTELTIQLHCNDRHLRMSVIDNGTGFDPSAISENHLGVGLKSMMARVKAIGGHIQFINRKSGGCEVRVTWIPQEQPSIEQESAVLH